MIKVAKYNDIYLIYGESEKYLVFDIYTSVHGNSIEIMLIPDEGNTQIINVEIPELDTEKRYVAYSEFTGRGTFMIFVINYNKLNELLNTNNVEFSVKTRELEESYIANLESDINYTEDKLKRLAEKYITALINEAKEASNEREKRKIMAEIYDSIEKYGKYIHPVSLIKLVSEINNILGDKDV